MARPVYRFGDYRIDPSARELHCAGELATLSPKVFDCLAYLIEHRDRAVGRDELIAAVWGRADVTDTLLGQTVLKARRAIGDTGNEQNAIRTIPRFGYRWVGELRVEAAPADAPAAARAATPLPPAAMRGDAGDAASQATAPPAPSAMRSRGRRWPLALALAALCLLPAVAFLLRRPAAPTAPPAAVAAAAANETVAVLPAVVDGGEEWAWLRLGLMDLVATRLRQGGQAVVPSDNIVALARSFAGAQAVDGDAAGAVRERSGAHYALVPQATRAGPQWQVRLELRGADGRRSEVQTQGGDPVGAARAASDRLLALLGKAPPSGDDADAALSPSEFLQRIEAALLGDDFAAARQLIEAAPAAQRDMPIVRLRLAQIDFHTGDVEAARASLQALLADVPAETDPVLRARILQTLGAIAVRDARNADAVAAFKEAVALAETQREPGVLGKSYTGLAVAMMDLQRFDESAAALARARVALSLAGDALGLAGVDDNEGLLDNARGRPADALAAFERAAATLRRFGIVNDLGLVVAAQIDTHLALLDAPAALAAGEAFLAQRPAMSNPRARNSFDLRRAKALAAAGRLADARALFYALQRAPAAAGQAGLLGVVASELAMLDLQGGNAEAAAAAARSALAGLPQVEQASERAKAWLTLVRALRATGRSDEARAQMADFAQWARAYPDSAGVQLVRTLAEAEQAWSGGDREGAWRIYAALLGQAEQRGVPEDVVGVVASYGNALIAAGELDRAGAVIGRAARWSERSFDCALLQARLYRALGEPDAWRAALARARALAGERAIPPPLDRLPGESAVPAAAHGP